MIPLAYERSLSGFPPTGTFSPRNVDISEVLATFITILAQMNKKKSQKNYRYLVSFPDWMVASVELPTWEPLLRAGREQQHGGATGDSQRSCRRRSRNRGAVGSISSAVSPVTEGTGTSCTMTVESPESRAPSVSASEMEDGAMDLVREQLQMRAS